MSHAHYLLRNCHGSLIKFREILEDESNLIIIPVNRKTLLNESVVIASKKKNKSL